MFYTSHKRNNGLNNFFPVLENILNEVANAPMEEFVKTPAKFTTRPKANVIEKDHGFEIALAIPGIKKENVKILVEKNDLIISSELENKDESQNFKFREFNYENFKRKFILPENVNKESIVAKFESGILTISLSKKEEAQPKTVEIK